MQQKQTQHLASAPVALFGIPIASLDLERTFRIFLEAAQHGQGGQVNFVNVHSLMESQSNSNLRVAFQNSFWNAADGVPLKWLASALGTPIQGRVCGPDFMKMALISKDPALAIQGFIGGVAGQGKKIAAEQGIQAVEYSPPRREFSEKNALEDWSNFLAQCPNQAPPPFVWVCLGAPKQELWMHAVSKVAPKVLFFGVGAAIDFFSGTKKRAPIWMQKTGLEWLFRLISEPKRLGIRYATTNFKFLALSLCEVIRKRCFSYGK